MRFSQDILKAQDSFFARGRVRRSRMGIKRDEIHFCAHTLQNPYQLFCLSRTVVYSVEQDIFERYPLSWRKRIFPAGPHKFGKRICPVYWHEFTPKLVVGG